MSALPKSMIMAEWKLTEGYSCVLLNPEFASSPVLKEFVFS